MGRLVEVMGQPHFWGGGEIFPNWGLRCPIGEGGIGGVGWEALPWWC